MNPPASEPLTLVPDGLDDEGLAVASADELRVHVLGALPGETVSAQIGHVSHHRKGTHRHAWADLLAVVTPSPLRVPPACPAYGACGGCVLQHYAEAGQLIYKRQRVVDALVGLPLPEIAACLPSPRSLGYRNQAKYVVGPAGTGGIVLGAYAPRSHVVVDLQGCRLGEAPQDEVAAVLRQLIEESGITPFDERTRTGLLRHVVLRTSAEGQVLVTLVTAKAEFSAGSALVAALTARVAAVVGVVQNVNPSPGNAIFGPDDQLLWGQGFLPEKFGAAVVDVGPRAFLQLNRAMAATAYAAIRTAIQAASAGQPASRLLDVFGGVGAIAFSVADSAREIVVIEENPAATAAGTAAARRAGLEHVRFVTAKAETALAAAGAADVVVLNPPRAGASAAVTATLLQLRPRLIAYLSCNPATLARDLGVLTASGYVVTSVQPLDMLPHTAHVETLVIAQAH